MTSILQTSLKDKKNRLIFKNSEQDRRLYKLFKLNAKKVGFMPLSKLPKKQLNNSCLVSGKTRSVYSKKFRLSRHQIKASFSAIFGLRNSSW